ncbi:hypothetical protein J2778_002663, partial [Paraburkholderia graminis]|nr:hypothetical protein [Paraburkholderia graminis]
GTMTSVSGTNGNADQINANGLQFGGTSANGLGTGIWLGANSQASILGSYNGVNVTAGDSVGVIGGGNTIDATAGSTVFVSGTNGTADMVFANGLTSGGVSANGQGTGIWMDANTQAIVQNGNDSIHLGTGDYLQLQGGSGYTVNGGANETIAIVGPQSDTISLVSGAERFYTTAGLEYQERDFQNGSLGELVNFDTLGRVTDEAFFNPAGQETEDAKFGPGASYSYEIDKFNANAAEIERDQFNAATGQLTDAMYFSPSTRLETEDIKFNPAAGPWSTEIIKFNASGQETEDDHFNAGTGALNSVYRWDGTNPYAYQEEFASGGAYFSQIDNFNAATGAQTSGANFDPFTGFESGYFNNGTWYSGGSGSTDYSDAGYTGTDSTPPWGDTEPPILGPDTGELNILVCGTGTDPIILNLDGESVETTSLSVSPASFDMQNNGQPVQTAWGTAGEGYLIFDPNDADNTTVITQDSQLVGGFGALQSLAQRADGSGSGSLTAGDALWDDLKVWVDTTGTGQFQSGQLYSLSQLGITSINLDGTQVNRDSNGNQILVDSTFAYADGTTGDIAGVNLMFNGSPDGPVTASLADLQINNLIASMATFGAQPAASSPLVAAAQQHPQTMLAASLH